MFFMFNPISFKRDPRFIYFSAHFLLEIVNIKKSIRKYSSIAKKVCNGIMQLSG